LYEEILDTATLEQHIKNKKLPRPILVFSGPEAFLKEKSFKDICRALIPESDQCENIFRIVCATKELPDLLNRIYSFSFNASTRVFFIQEIESIPAKSRKEFLDKLQNGGIPADTVLIFNLSDNRAATEIASKFKQQSEKIDFWAPFANQLAAWLKKEAAELKCNISQDAADLLIELAGSDLSLLFQELNKLAIACKGKIGLADVKAGVSYLRQDNVFDFLEAFGQRSVSRSVRCIESLLNSGEAAQKLWFMLCRQIREFRLFHELSAARPDLFDSVISALRQYSQLAAKSDYRANQEKKNIIAKIQEMSEEFPPAITEKAGLKQIGKLKNLYLALNFDRFELINAWPMIIQTDLHLKSGADARVVLQNFVAGFLTSRTS